MRSTGRWMWKMLSPQVHRSADREKQWWRLLPRKSARAVPSLTMTSRLCLSKLPEKIRTDPGSWGLFIYNAVSIGDAAHDAQYSNAPSIQSVWVECECSPLFQEGKQARMRKYFTLDYLILWVVSSHLSAWMSKCSRCDSYELSDDVIL